MENNWSQIKGSASAPYINYFAENSLSCIGARRFAVAINGAQVLSNFDVLATAGAEHKALVQSFTANANSAGQIVINFSGVTPATAPF